MKYLYKLTMLLIALTMSINLMATDYVVSGAGSTAVNGTYSPDGTNFLGNPRWKLSGYSYYLHSDGNDWVINSKQNFPTEGYYTNYSSSDPTIPPSTGWDIDMGEYPAPTVAEVVSGPGISYSSSIFTEFSANDGSIDNSQPVIITHNNFGGETFTGSNGDDFVDDGKVLVTNLSVGLTAVITRTSSTTLSVTLTGNVTSHKDVNDVLDLTFTFQNTAFSGNDASAVSNATKNDLEINYFQEYNIGSGGDYASITAALSAFSSFNSDGNILNLAAETFTENNLNISNLTIKGQGAGSTIVQAAATQNTASYLVFITSNTVIEDITVRYGNNTKALGAGGIYNTGALTLNNCNISNNNTTHSGGGIQSSKALTVNNCNISNNNASNCGGGGIYCTEGTLTVNNSTISNNVCVSTSAYGGYGSGILLMSYNDDPATCTMTNCTVFGNITNGGYDTEGALATWNNGNIFTIINSTISGNDGGLISKSEGEFIVENTIIAGNDSKDYWVVNDGTVTDNGNNIVETQSVSNFNNPTDILYSHDYLGNTEGASGLGWNKNDASIGGSLNLSSTLADNNTINGTQTLAIESGSFAISAGSWNASITTDQRGKSRHEYYPTIGAYELTQYPGYWTGASDHDWNTSSNWDDGSVASASDDVIIPDVANDPVINEVPDTPAVCDKLTILSGATFTINAGKAMTINGDLDNSGTLTVNSSDSGTASLIVNGTSTGNVTMQRYMNNADWDDWQDGWHFVSSPVADYPIESNFTVTTAADYDFYAWSEPDNEWINFKDGIDPTFVSVNGSDDFELGHGYMVAYKNADTKNFTGTINVDDVAITGLTITGEEPEYRSWHLLGNPFTSALTWDATDDWNKINIAGTAEIWNEDGQSYSSISSGEIIPATNGFMVQVSSETASLTIPASKRVHHAQAFYKSSNYPAIKLKANNLDHPSFQESKILFNPESTKGYEIEYDGDFLAGYAPLFYSLIDGNPMAVNSMPYYSENTLIPFTFIKNEGLNFSIEMYEIENIDLDVYLFDKKTNHEQNLSKNPVYAFTSFEGDDIERFEIRFKSVGIEENQIINNIQIWSSDKNIYFLNPDHQKGIIKIINMYGQILIETQLNGNEKQEVSVNIKTGNYVINIIGDNKVISKKIFVR